MKRILIAVVMLLGLAVVASPTASAAPHVAAKAASCTVHYKDTNALQWDASHAYSYASNSGWYKSIWDWNSCSGGVYLKLVFNTNCHLDYWEGVVAANGVIQYYILLGSRGATCNATPGTLRLVTDGSMRTYSAAGTLLSNTGASGSSPYRWELNLLTGANPYMRERAMAWCSVCGDYTTKWFGPAEYIQ